MTWQVALIILIAVVGFTVLGYGQAKMWYYQFKSFKAEIETALKAEDSELISFRYPVFQDWPHSPYSMIEINNGGLRINGKLAQQKHYRIIEIRNKFKEKETRWVKVETHPFQEPTYEWKRV